VGSAVFDEEHLVSCAGLVPVMSLAEQTGLGRLLGEKVRIAVPRIKSGAANPAPKLATVVAGMCAGADSIDDIDVVRSGGMKTLFGGVYAPSTVGTLLREFTFGHARQLESVLREHLVALFVRVGWSPRRSPPPAPPGSPVRSWSAVTRPTAPARWWPPAAAPASSSPWC